MPLLPCQYQGYTTNTSKEAALGALPIEGGLGSFWKMGGGGVNTKTNSGLRGGREEGKSRCAGCLSLTSGNSWFECCADQVPCYGSNLDTWNQE